MIFHKLLNDNKVIKVRTPNRWINISSELNLYPLSSYLRQLHKDWKTCWNLKSMIHSLHQTFQIVQVSENATRSVVQTCIICLTPEDNDLVIGSHDEELIQFCLLLLKSRHDNGKFCILYSVWTNFISILSNYQKLNFRIYIEVSF